MTTDGGASQAGAGGGSAASAGIAGAGAGPSTGGLSATGGDGAMGAPTAPGYAAWGTWRGYAWASAAGDGSSISPDQFDGAPSNGPFCAKGTVGEMADWSGVAMVGINLNQAVGEDTAPMTWSPEDVSGDVRVDVSGQTSNLRVQIQGRTGTTNGDDRWCAPINGRSVIPLSEFNTECWGDDGADYAGQPLESAMILVPGLNDGDVAFDFCLNRLEYTGAGSGGTGGDGAGDGGTGGGGSTGGPGKLGSGTMSGTGTTSDRYRTINVERNGQPYKLITNGWGSQWQSHTISWNGTSFSVDAFQGQDNGSGGPAGYPSLYCGTYSSTGNAPCGIPAPIGALQSVDVGWSWEGGNGEYNSAFDIWMGDGTESQGFYMVWLRDPPDWQPAGSIVENDVTVPGLPGTWDIWHTDDGPFGRGITNWVRNEGSDLYSIEFDVMDLIADAEARGYTVPGAQLNGVAVGFEIWNGPLSNVRTTDFYVDVN